MVHRETFLKIHLHQMNRQQLVSEMQEVFQLHIANLSLNTGRSFAENGGMRKNQEVVNLDPPSHAEGAYPQKCMVEQERAQVLEVNFDEFTP